MTSEGKDDIGTWVALAAFDLAAITSIDARLPREAFFARVRSVRCGNQIECAAAIIPGTVDAARPPS
jgi:hypothetical protein